MFMTQQAHRLGGSGRLCRRGRDDTFPHIRPPSGHHRRPLRPAADDVAERHRQRPHAPSLRRRPGAWATDRRWPSWCVVAFALVDDAGLLHAREDRRHPRARPRERGHGRERPLLGDDERDAARWASAVSGTARGRRSTPSRPTGFFAARWALTPSRSSARPSSSCACPSSCPSGPTTSIRGKTSRRGSRYVRGRHDLKVMIALLAAFRLSVAPFFVFYLAANKEWFGNRPANLLVDGVRPSSPGCSRGAPRWAG